MNKITKWTTGLLLIITLIIKWPQSEKNALPEDVESAINSIDPVPVYIPEVINNDYHKITLGDWSKINIICAFPERDDGHVSRNKLKRKEAVLKKADIQQFNNQ